MYTYVVEIGCFSIIFSVVSHVEQVLAIELLAACQALEFHRPRTTTAPLEAIHKVVRTVIRWAVPFHDNLNANLKFTQFLQTMGERSLHGT